MSDQVRRSGRARKAPQTYNEGLVDSSGGSSEEEDVESERETSDDDVDDDEADPKQRGAKKKSNKRERRRSTEHDKAAAKNAAESTEQARQARLEQMRAQISKVKGMQSIPPVLSPSVADKAEEKDKSPINREKLAAAITRSPQGSVASRGGMIIPALSLDPDAKADQGKKQVKRPVLRPAVQRPARPGPDLRPPEKGCKTNWNASEVIKDFLYIGAAWDRTNRILVNRDSEEVAIKQERHKWCSEHNLCYALNMAGSPFQSELRGIRYPLQSTEALRIDMNDLDTWDAESMVKGFEEGARFIESVWEKHLKCKSTIGGTLAPSIFVHCVAGVNRSPMCVVWWLSRYHGIHIHDAWEIVRTRRDEGAHWTNVTLGGEPPPEGFIPNLEEIQAATLRKHQHRYDVAKVTASGNSFSAGEEQAQGDVKYPKCLWYIEAEKLLQKYFRWKVDLKGIATEIPGAKYVVSSEALFPKKDEPVPSAASTPADSSAQALPHRGADNNKSDDTAARKKDDFPSESKRNEDNNANTTSGRERASTLEGAQDKAEEKSREKRQPLPKQRQEKTSQGTKQGDKPREKPHETVQIQSDPKHKQSVLETNAVEEQVPVGMKRAKKRPGGAKQSSTVNSSAGNNGDISKRQREGDLDETSMNDRTKRILEQSPAIINGGDIVPVTTGSLQADRASLLQRAFLETDTGSNNNNLTNSYDKDNASLLLQEQLRGELANRLLLQQQQQLHIQQQLLQHQMQQQLLAQQFVAQDHPLLLQQALFQQEQSELLRLRALQSYQLQQLGLIESSQQLPNYSSSNVTQKTHDHLSLL